MSHGIVAKFEIDVLVQKELKEAHDLAVRHSMPALVIHPDLCSQAQFIRARERAQYKIITMVDWPKGERTGLDKFMHLGVEAMESDGFEIILNQQTSVDSAIAEIAPIVSFVKRYIARPVEIRFVLQTTDRPETSWGSQCECLSQVQPPDYVRTTHLTSLQQAKANVVVSAATIESIKAKTTRPIKLSGNVSTVKMLAHCQATRYAVSLKQANDLITELRDHPDRYEEHLNALRAVAK